MGEPLINDKGRWANESLYLEYAYCAIEEPKYKEQCCSLWFEDKAIKSAVKWLNERIKSMDIPKGKNLVLETINLAFQDLINNPEKNCFNHQCLDYKGNRCYGDEPENCDRRIVNTASNEKTEEE